MIRLTMYVDKDGTYVGFKSEGHANDAPRGESLVCAGISTVVFGAYYFIEYESSAEATMSANDGVLSVRLKGPNHDAQVALRQLITSVEMVKQGNPGIKIITKRGGYAR